MLHHSEKFSQTSIFKISFEDQQIVPKCRSFRGIRRTRRKTKKSQEMSVS